MSYAAGTMILTPHGERPVEKLVAGNLVETADRGAQQILWVGHREVDFVGQNPIDAVRPIRLSAGCLGAGLPRRDMIVSPQHKVLLSGPVVFGMFGADAVLVPACGLGGLPGVRVTQGCRRVSYHHILVAGHEVVFANGIAAETLFPSENEAEMMPTPQRKAIVTLIPGLRSELVTGHCATAQLVLSRRDARALVRALLEHEWGEISERSVILRPALPDSGAV